MQGEAAVEVDAATTCRRVGMRAEAAVEVEVQAVLEGDAATTRVAARGPEATADWQTVDRALRVIAQRRAALVRSSP